jgi:hypothetical protein
MVVNGPWDVLQKMHAHTQNATMVVIVVQKSHVEPPRNDFCLKSSGTERIIICQQLQSYRGKKKTRAPDNSTALQERQAE